MPGPAARRPYTRFTRWRRRRFFALLEESGNIQMAAELAGVGLGCIYRLRRVEPGFVALIDAARARAAARLAAEAAGAEEALDEGLTIRRGPGGRLRVIAAGRGWTARHDRVFLAQLAVTGNVKLSARAAGFTPKSAWNRRAVRPGFAAAWDAALAGSGAVVAQRLAAELIRRFDPPPEAVGQAAAGPLDIDAAIHLLRWHRRG